MMTSIEAGINSISQVAIGTITLGKLVPALIVLVICLIAKRTALRLLKKALEISRLERSLHAFLLACANVGMYVFIVLIVADSLGIPVTSLIALLSVAGLAVSLAVQGTLSNIAGGILLLLSKPFVVGDFVEAGGVSGTVQEIGLVYTKLSTVDNKMIFAPNGEISGAKIINYTSEGRRRIEILVGAAYESPVKTVKEALLAVTARHEEIFSSPAPFANVNAYQDHCIEYVLRAWVRTDTYWDVYFAMLEEVKEEFDLRGIEMTYPHLNVHMVP